MKNFYYTVLFFAGGFIANAQTPAPAANNNLQLNVSLSDEFDGPQLDWEKWKRMDQTDIWITAYPSLFYPENSSVSGGNLILSATDETHTAGVTSIRENLHYGYYEIRAQLAQYNDPVTDSLSTDGMWGGFWLVKSRSHPAFDAPSYVMLHDEIDIQERMLDGTVHSGVHISQGPNVPPAQHVNSSYGQFTTEEYEEYKGFHKFGLLYTPDSLTFYVDDKIEPHKTIRKSVLGSDFFASHPMKVLLTHQLNEKINGQVNGQWCPIEDRVLDSNGNLVCCPVANRTMNGNVITACSGENWQPALTPARPWPIDFIVDYFRFYEYMGQINNNVTASTVTTLNNNFDFTSPTNGVRNNITINNATSYVQLSTTRNYLMRARGTTTIKGRFRAPAGSKLKIVPTPASVPPPAPQFAAKSLSVDSMVEDAIIVYPNPASSIVSFKGKNLDSYIMSLYNLEGRKVLEKSISEPVNISSLSKGMYIYLLSDDAGNKQQGKLVIE